MTNIRIGNDLPITWRVTRGGVPEDFSGKALALYLTNRYGKYSVSDYIVDGSTIQFVYPGRKQTHLGEYGLLLVENDGREHMSTVDVYRAFCLVPTSCHSCECESEVHLASDISVPANGLSAYELAIINGFTGTKEEWLESIRQPAIEAADKANAAVGRTDEAIHSMDSLYESVLASENQRVHDELERIGNERDREDAEQQRQADTASAIRRTNESAQAASEAARNVTDFLSGAAKTLAEKQDKKDDSLKTTDKTVAGAVNEIYDNMIVAVEFTEEDIDKLWQ